MSDESSAPASVSEAPVSTEAPAATQDTLSTPEQLKAPVTNPNMHKIKIDGQDVEVTTEELIRHYGKGQAADKRFQEASQMKSQAEQFIHKLKTDPLSVLQDPRIGHDVKKLAEDYLVNQMRREAMSPEEIQIQEKLERLEKLERDNEETKTKAEETQAQALRDRYTQEYQKDIISALETSGLPKTEHTVKRMAYYLHSALEQGYELKAKDVADLVKKDYINEIKALYSNLDGNVLQEMMGEDVAKKFRATDLARLKNPEKGGRVNNNTETPNKVTGVNKSKTTKEWRKSLEKYKDSDD
jgi:hypothetical protein